MNRFIRIIIAIGAGLFINFAIAMACATWSPIPLEQTQQPPLPIEECREMLRARGRTVASDDLCSCYRYRCRGMTLRSEVHQSPDDAKLMITTQAGLPFRAFHGEQHFGGAYGSGLGFDRCVTAFIIPARLRDEGSFPWLWPYRPMPVGFVMNTALYAGLVFVAISARRWRRLRRGQCPACAYPMGRSPVCTECGVRLTRRQVEA